LLELLVVLALLSLVMLGTLTALRGTAQVETRVDARIERADDVRVLRAFLSQLTCCVWTGRRPLAQAGQSTLFFEGAPDRVAWVGVLPARVGLGGQYFLSLTLEARAQGEADLVLRYAPYTEVADWPDWGAAPRRVLMTDVGPATFTFDDLRTPDGWVTHWADTEGLPARLGLQMRTELSDETMIRLPFRALASRNGIDGEFGVGGTGQ
jgi:general secretion pathway protein J